MFELKMFSGDFGVFCASRLLSFIERVLFNY